MDELKPVIASNLIRLRQQAGMTQADLGKKLNYSDKAISKWERAESLPDVYVLSCLAALYGVTVDDILRPAETWEIRAQKEAAEARRFSATVVSLVAVAGIWTTAVTIFVILWLALGSAQWLWLVFTTAVPVSLIALLVFNSLWNHGRGNVLLVMALVATLIAAIYLFLLPFNPWQLFLILAPAEVLVFFSFRIRHGLKTLFKKRSKH